MWQSLQPYVNQPVTPRGPACNPMQGAPETFVPLDTIRTTPIAERLRQLGGSKRPVIDVISINDERFLRAVQYAVGDAVVCDSLDEARTLARSHARTLARSHDRTPRRGATG